MVKQSCSSTTGMSSGRRPASEHLVRGVLGQVVADDLHHVALVERRRVSVVRAWARIAHVGAQAVPAGEVLGDETAAAAPQVGGQHCSRDRWPKMCGEASTSSTVTGSRNTAYGLCAACRRDLTETCANVSGAMP